MFGRLVAHHAAVVAADVPEADVVAPQDEDVRLAVGHDAPLFGRRRGTDPGERPSHTDPIGSNQPATMPQQRLYFLPLPQGQGSLRPVVRASSARSRHDLARLAAAARRISAIRRIGPLGVGEERLEPGAEPVQAGLAVGRQQDAVLGALAVAGEEVLAGAAEGGQRLLLGPAEGALLLGAHEVADRRLDDVAEQVTGVDEVVARVQVAVVLERDALAAGGLEDAQARGARARRRPARRRRSARTSRPRRGAPTRRRWRQEAARSRAGCTLRSVTVPGRPLLAAASRPRRSG